MTHHRPDLSLVAPEVRSYVESLEAEIARLRAIQAAQASIAARKARSAKSHTEKETVQLPLKPEEPPTTIQVISISERGIAKRTARHLYQRQHRGGMGIFDLDVAEEDPVRILLTAEPEQHILLFTNLARAFRISTRQISEGEVHSKGTSIIGKWSLEPDEHFTTAIIDEAKGAVALVSQTGFVRYLRHHVFGEYMKPGTVMFDTRRNGELSAVCRTSGDADLLIISQNGKAIRFSEKLVPPQGGSGMRLDADSPAVAIVSITDADGVFLIDKNGRGTIRLMGSFTPNKSAGGGGKIIMNSNDLVGAFAVTDENDIFVISKLCKIVRFMAAEVPAKEGNVQGVNCMSLRGDEVVTATATR